MKAYYCDDFVLPLPEGHSFPMAKYSRLRERVLTDGIVDVSALVTPEAAEWDDLALAHDRHYLEQVRTGTLPREMQRRIGFPWSPGMVERARRSVGGTIAASRHAITDGVAVNLAGGTHHAFSDRGEGYCVFNDIAVAARALLREGLATRIAIVDCDVHQGNGTAAIFKDDRAVFTCSIHGEKNFPFRKEPSDLDIYLPDGTRDEAYLEALDQALDAVFERQRPEFIFYLAGADPFEGDRLGRLSLTIDGLAERDRRVLDACCDVPIAVTMGGGYCPVIDTIVTIHANTVRAAAEAGRRKLVTENR